MLHELGDDLHTAIGSIVAEERGEALYRLASVGLVAYSNAYSDSRVQMDNLRVLYDEFVSQWKGKENFLTKHRNSSRAPEHLDGVQKIRKDKVPAASVGKRIRKPRPDSMSHYPFADEVGDVNTILNPNTETKGKFLEMGIPARRRVVKRVYEEMKSCVFGISSGDLSEALQSIGLYVPYNLEAAIKGIDSSITESNAKSNTTYLNYERFTEFVDKYTRVLVSGEIDNVSIEYLISQKSKPDDLSQYDIEDKNLNDVFGEQNIRTSQSPNKSAPVKPASIISKTSLTKVGEVPLSISPQNNKWKDSHTSRLRRTQSKIKEQVRRDRRHFQRIEEEVTRPVMESIARHRVDQILSQPLQTSDSRNKDLTAKSNKRIYDLTSGSAALAIADAFLKGSLGKEIALQTNSDVTASPESSSFISQSPLESPVSNLSSGWKGNRGGWVADFGAIHTSTLAKNLSSTPRHSRGNYFEDSDDDSIPVRVSRL